MDDDGTILDDVDAVALDARSSPDPRALVEEAKSVFAMAADSSAHRTVLLLQPKPLDLDYSVHLRLLHPHHQVWCHHHP
jgi:hypothetical protein